ncbi:NADH dehydrogenase [ubiquinone] 1 beta subcomplex subunit 1 isoform X3 [Ambystoma mexicanum]|uniref:NADH dehydrogenase [ubiquinone] 1 beta subcomplex subunit 1 isoform X3 n=1 Tax=Ambystoma mexicanum TaxID=8296 RepID=UPI0037E92810
MKKPVNNFGRTDFYSFLCDEFKTPSCSLLRQTPSLVPSPDCPLPALAAAVATMVKVLNFVRDHWANVFVPLGFVIGWYWDRKNDEGLTEFRNKSLLFKRELRPNEEVTWK